MKTVLYSLLFCSCLMLSCSNNINQTEFINTDNLVLLKINSNTSKQQLVDIKKELKETKDIDLNFDNCLFDKENMITKVDLQVSTTDGYKGSITSSKAGLFNQNYGFLRDYTKGAKTAFMTGNSFPEL